MFIVCCLYDQAGQFVDIEKLDQMTILAVDQNFLERGGSRADDQTACR
jgi:hypothetical protein